jgi:signal transduction histidine kinase
MIFSLLIANFILKVNSDISAKLHNQGKELMNKNALLNSTLETKDKLLAVVSHDLRSPFLAIEASIEMLSDPDTEETERRMILNSLNRKSESTLALLNNLLLWSQSQTDAIKFEPEPIYLDELEVSVNGVLRILAEEKKLTLNIDFEPGVAVFADKNMLDSIIRNLISNAVKFSNNGSSIDLIGKFEDGLVIFTVQDYGVGMNEHVVKKLRQKSPFTIDGTQKETGHGIGLVLVHQFISAHESELQVSSEKGEGTMFQFKLKAVSG